jgi:hypothetical protein
MFRTDAERKAQAEGIRLTEMYSPATETHTIGASIVRVCQRYRKAQQHIRQLIFLLEHDEEMIERQAFIDAKEFLSAIEEEQSVRATNIVG